MPTRRGWSSLGSSRAAAVALSAVMAACGGAQGDDLSDLVEPLTPDEEDLSELVEALEAPGHGTITIRKERRGTYTSNRDNPVEVEFSEEATIRFVLDTDDA